MIRIIKLTLIASITVFLSSCWHEMEEAVKAEEVIKTEKTALSAAPVKAVLVETDMMPSRSK